MRGDATDLEGIRVFELKDGWEILVGRTARDNDRLSLRIGRPFDFWFHVAGTSGSHVIARHPDRPERCPRQVKTISAGLAAFFSKSRNARKAVVHWTTCKNVSKRKGAPDGQVTLKKFEKTLVAPIDPQAYFGGKP